MSHQCVHCGKIYPVGSKELLTGCTDCKSHFFFYVKDLQTAESKELEEVKNNLIELPKEQKSQIEKDVREMAGITEEQTPVILDLESVRVSGPGKFEIDLVKLFNKKRPLVYKLEEGKYIIDLSPTLSEDVRNLKEIQNPNGNKKS